MSMDTSKPIVKWRGGQIVNQAQPHYAGASQSARFATWYAPGSGPNRAMLGNLVTLRNRSRAEMRNNPWIAQGINKLTSNEIGIGIKPRSRAKNEKLRDLLNYFWSLFVDECDADGVNNIYGLQGLGAGNRRSSGEVFIRRRRRSLADGLTVPVQIQVLEADFVPVNLDKKLPNGNKIVAGIEFDLIGRRVAYWMHREHPGDNMGFEFNQLVRVPAADVIHHYKQLRPGQIRGIPDTVQALPRAHDYDEYDDAELNRKKQRAPYTGFIAREPHPSDFMYDPLTGNKIVTTNPGELPPVDVQSGTILTGIPGESLTLFDGDDTGQGYGDYQWLQKMAIAAGIEIPYEIMSGDWSKVNDRLVRAIMGEFRRTIMMDQDFLTIFQVCRGVRQWFIEALLMSEHKLPSYIDNIDDYRRVDWQPHDWPYINPEQDVSAKVKKIEAGLSSRQSEIAKEGRDAEEVDRQNAEDEARIQREREKAGLPLTPEAA